MSTLKFATRATFIKNKVEGDISDDEVSSKQLEKLDEAAALHPIEFDSSGNCVIPSCAGKISCIGDVSAGPSAPLVMLLHYYGHGGDATMWRHAISDLVACGHRVLAPSFPGHGSTLGKSSSKMEDLTKPKGPVEIVKSLVDYVGASKVSFLGYDWGGGIAFAFALKYRKRVAKLMGWCISYRNPDDLAPLKKKGQKGEVLLLWEKDDLNHSYKKGQMVAKVVGVKLKNIDGSWGAMKEAAAFLRKKGAAGKGK